MSPTRGKVMAQAYSTTSSSSTSGFSTDTEGQAQKAPRPVPFSPPKASLERDDFFRLYKVFCNLTGHDYQVCCTSNSNSNSPGWLPLTGPAATPGTAGRHTKDVTERFSEFFMVLEVVVPLCAGLADTAVPKLTRRFTVSHTERMQRWQLTYRAVVAAFFGSKYSKQNLARAQLWLPSVCICVAGGDHHSSVPAGHS